MSRAQESLKLRIDGVAGPESFRRRHKNCDDRRAHFSSSTLTIRVQNFQPMHASCMPLASLELINATRIQSKIGCPSQPRDDANRNSGTRDGE